MFVLHPLFSLTPPPYLPLPREYVLKDGLKLLKAVFYFIKPVRRKDSADVDILSNYILIATGLTWRQGQEECERLGGFLAEIKTPEQQNFLVGLEGEIWKVERCFF